MKVLKETRISVDGRKYKFITKLTGSVHQEKSVCKYCAFYDSRRSGCGGISNLVYTDTGDEFRCDDQRPSMEDDGLDFMETEYYYFVEEDFKLHINSTPYNQSQEEREMVANLLG